jgi:hypothetical protein
VSSVELIPGTTLPFHTGPGGFQPEGRGEIIPNPEHRSPSLLEKIGSRDDLSATELAFAAAALRAYDHRSSKVRDVYASAGGVTDATTGNIVVPLFEVPAGMFGHVAQVTVDAVSSATITPAAPYANASSWAYIAIAPASSMPANPAATALRAGMAAFAPSSAAGPIIPGQWTFNDTNAPVAWGGEQVYFVLVGGSVAAVKSLNLQVTYRINLYSREK